MADPDMQASAVRSASREEEIVALVEYAGAFGDGPAIPDVDPAAGDLAAGGELYRLNCAACHVASRRRRGDRRRPRGAVADGVDADRDRRGDPRRAGGDAGVRRRSATRTSTTSPRYIVDLQDARDDVASTTSAAPVRSPRGSPRGCSALLPLIALTRWIGTPHEGRDAGAEPAASTSSEVDVTAQRRAALTRRRRTTRHGRPVNQRAYRAAIVAVRRRHRRRHRRGRSATAPSNTGDLLGLGLAAALVGIGFGLVCVGQVPRPRRARRAGARAAGDHAGRTQDELHEELELTRRDRSVGAAARRPARRFVRQPASSGSSGRSARSGRSRAASAAARRGGPESRLVTADGDADRGVGTALRPAGHGVPGGRTSASTTPRSCCCGCRPSCSPSARRAAAPSRAGSRTPRSAPTPAARSGCSASTTGRPTRCASSCARATSRCSTRSTAPARSAARRPRSLPAARRSTSTPTATSSPRATSTGPSARSPGTRQVTRARGHAPS